MYEYADRDETRGSAFWYGDAEFSRSSFEKLRRIGRKDMFEALGSPTEVRRVGNYAFLYRHGTHKKHRLTDPPDPGASESEKVFIR